MTASYPDLVAAARREITEITPEQLAERGPANVALIDVREREETAQGMIPSAVHVPRGRLEGSIASAGWDRNQPIVLYCSAGERSALAAVALQRMGYANVMSLAEGFGGWRMRGLPWVSPASGSGPPGGAGPSDRYARHLALPEVGPDGQRRLGRARVLLVGAGGLGSPAALYLAAAGVGTIGLVDYDLVDVTNLQRQIIHTTAGVGVRKTDSARLALAALNPEITVRAHHARLQASNILEILEGYELAVDGADNFPTRYLLNDAAVRTGTPVAHGAVHRFEGQVSLFDPRSGPCYRCLFPLPPPPESAPNCAEAGVLGALPGVIGTLQAVEALKWLLGAGDPLTGRLLTYDGLAGEFRTLSFNKNPQCPACSDPAQPPPLRDYDQTCSPAA